MIIRQNKIKSVKCHLPDGLLNESIYICIPVNDVKLDLLQKIGFKDSNVGQEIVPAPQFKRVAFFNAEGGFVRRTDLPKETVYREREWTWTDYTGYEHSKTVYVPYQRYQRDPISAPEETLSIAQNVAGEVLITSKELIYDASTEKRLKHVINLFLEIFGYCEIRNSRLDSVIKSPVVKLNWDILPKGTSSWSELLEKITPALNRIVKPSVRTVMTDRLNRLDKLNPDFVAVGRGGFYGYVIFGFENKSRFVLESIYSGNAIYVFGRDWKKLSQMTKGEILDGSLQIDRIFHQEGYWKSVMKHVA